MEIAFGENRRKMGDSGWNTLRTGNSVVVKVHVVNSVGGLLSLKESPDSSLTF